MTIEHIPRFEELNTDYVIIVIYPCCEDKTFMPIYASKHQNRKHIVNLLFLDRSEKRHYVFIRDSSRLLASRNSYNGRTFPCPYCLHCFTREYSLNSNMPDCGVHGLQAARYPEPGKNILKFRNIYKQFPVGVYLVCEFDSCLIPSGGIDPSKSTNFIDTHELSGFSCFAVSSILEINDQEPIFYSGPRVMDRFFSHLFLEQVRINEILSRNVPMRPLSEKQLKEFAECSICRE